MATNGMVALKSKDGSVRCSYVRSDFSHSFGMKYLYKYYLTADRVNDLLDFGTINSVRPYLSPYFGDSVETYMYRDNDGEWIEDNTNVEYGTFKEFMDAAYRDYYVWDPVFTIMLFDEETNEWYIVNKKTRKIVPFEEHYLDRFDDTLEEVEEYHAFVQSLLSPEAQKVLDAHGRQFGTYMHKEFDEKTYYQANKLLSLENSIKKAKQNGGILPKNSVVDLSDEDELEAYHDIFQGRSRKPEIMDFVVEQMRGMSFEEIEEKIVRNGLQVPDKGEQNTGPKK